MKLLAYVLIPLAVLGLIGTGYFFVKAQQDEAQLTILHKSIDDANATSKSSDTKLQDAEKQISTLQSDKDKINADLSTAKVSLATIQADLDNAKAALENEKNIEAGDRIAIADLQKKASTSPSAPSPQAATPATNTAPSLNFQDYAPSLIVMEGDQEVGSGFVLKLADGPHIITNSHVLSGNTTMKIRTMGGKITSPDTLQIAQDADLASLPADPSIKPLELLQDVGSNVAVGDDVVVLGNSQGAGVATQIMGKVLGVGPQVIEVDAKFVPGNSGSPVIHVKTGKVIGVATYSITMKVDSNASSANSETTVERRFACRLDNIQVWKPMAWADFVQESNVVKSIDDNTDLLISLWDDIRKNGRVTYQNYLGKDNILKDLVSDLQTHMAAAQPVSTVPTGFNPFYNMLNQQMPIPAGTANLDIKTKFLYFVIDLCDKDTNSVNPDNFISYHKDVLTSDIQARQELEEVFKALSSKQDNSTDFLHVTHSYQPTHYYPQSPQQQQPQQNQQ